MSASATLTAPPAPDVHPAQEQPATPGMTVQQYFELERTSEIRHEYVDGVVIPMSGESLTHNQIAGNFYTRLAIAFEDRDCTVYMEGVRLRVSPTKYRYPDVVALCDDPVTDGDNPPALLNPLLVVEVLSPSTEAIDEGEKFVEYRGIAGLTDYVLIKQDRVSVTHGARQNARQWILTEYNELTDTLTFISLGVTLRLADLYRKVTFAAPASSISDDIPA